MLLSKIQFRREAHCWFLQIQKNLEYFWFRYSRKPPNWANSWGIQPHTFTLQIKQIVELLYFFAFKCQFIHSMTHTKYQKYIFGPKSNNLKIGGNGAGVQCSSGGSKSKNQNCPSAGHPLGVPRTGIQCFKFVLRSISYGPSCLKFYLFLWILMWFCKVMVLNNLPQRAHYLKEWILVSLRFKIPNYASVRLQHI